MRSPRSLPALAAYSARVIAMVICALAMAPGPAHAHSYKLGDIAVGHIWAKPPDTGADGVAVYAPVLNSGKTTARLVGASTPIADKVRFRIVAKDGKVEWPKAIEFRPGKPVTLAGWRAHIWVSGLHERLDNGDWFDLTLDFGDKGKLPVKVRVEESPGH